MNKPIITKEGTSLNNPVTDLFFKFNNNGGEIRIGSITNPELIQSGWYHISELDIHIFITSPKDNDSLWNFSEFTKCAK